MPRLAVLFCLLLILPVLVLSQQQRHYTCYRTTGPIQIDGKATEPDWQAAPWSNDFTDITGKPELKPPLQTRVRMLWDDRYIYILAELQEPGIWATIRERDAVIFHDNDFEVFIDPEGKSENYCEIEINAFGTVWDLMLTKPYKDRGKPLNGWNLDGMRSAIGIRGTLNDPASADTAWTVEMALPVDELMNNRGAAFRPANGVQWRLNFSRVEWKTKTDGNAYRKLTNPSTGKPLPEDNWTWSPMGEVSMHIPSRWGWLEFVNTPVTPEPLVFLNQKQEKDFKVWVWMGGREGWNAAQWDSLMLRLKESGINGILTHAGPPVMKEMVPAAHRHGIRIEKWFTALMNNDSALVHGHPDWFVVNREGKSSVTNPAYVGYYRFLCPSRKEVLAVLKEKMDPCLGTDGPDAIHLDYIRFPDVILPVTLWEKYGIVQDREYPPYDYCYCEVCRNRFMREGGSDPLRMEHPDLDPRWRQFRCDRVTELVDSLAAYCRQRGKSVSAAVFPGPSVSAKLVRQEWNKWPLDEVMPMLYQSFYREDLDWIRRETAEAVQSLPEGRPVYSGLYIPDLTPRDLHAALAAAIKGGASGVALFNLEALTADHWQVVRSCFGTAGGH